MIKGTGADILRIADVKQSIKKMGWSFVHQILGRSEINVFSEIRDDDESIMYLARHLAAKEAIAKAIPDTKIDMRRVQIFNEANGQPRVYTDQVQGVRFHLTMSDCGDYVMAVVVCESA